MSAILALSCCVLSAHSAEYIERPNEAITLIYSAVTLNTNSESTSVSFRTLVSEISSIVLTVSSLCACILNFNNLKLKIRSSDEYIQSNI